MRSFIKLTDRSNSPVYVSYGLITSIRPIQGQGCTNIKLIGGDLVIVKETFEQIEKLICQTGINTYNYQKHEDGKTDNTTTTTSTTAETTGTD